MKLQNKPKKSLGQNFLIDKNIINKIIKIANINQKDTIMEIGSGHGNLTEEIALLKPKNILSIEKDKNLVQILRERLKGFKNIKIINQDILNLINEYKFDKNVIVFGNLPYNISTKILSSLILLNKWPPWYDVLIFMFQKEVAERIIAKSKTKEFGRLSILSNWRLNVKRHFNVSRNCFYPKPNVDSTVLSFVPKRKNLFKLKNPKNLEEITRIFFSSRRKMINKNFNKLFIKNTLIKNKLNIDLNKRPEELSCETYYKITAEYEKLFD